MRFRVGTASWTDPTLIAAGTFYPPGPLSAADRLRFYASRFDTVEVDSTYYALPSERNARLWVARTPDDFVFHVKAFALLTTHSAETARLPRAVRDLLTEEELSQARLRRPRPGVREACFEMFLNALDPLRDAGKLGMLLFQFPPWFAPTVGNARYIQECCERVGDRRIAVEFRHPGWVEAGRCERTLELLRRLGATFVIVDAPRVRGAPPTVMATTTDEAYVRFHGRNAAAWNRKGLTAAERFRYLYSDEELQEWADRLRSLSGVREVHAVFNNCYADYGVRNAATMKRFLASPG